MFSSASCWGPRTMGRPGGRSQGVCKSEPDGRCRVAPQGHPLSGAPDCAHLPASSPVRAPLKLYRGGLSRRTPASAFSQRPERVRVLSYERVHQALLLFPELLV